MWRRCHERLPRCGVADGRERQVLPRCSIWRSSCRINPPQPDGAGCCRYRSSSDCQLRLQSYQWPLADLESNARVLNRCVPEETFDKAVNSGCKPPLQYELHSKNSPVVRSQFFEFIAPPTEQAGHRSSKSHSLESASWTTTKSQFIDSPTLLDTPSL